MIRCRNSYGGKITIKWLKKQVSPWKFCFFNNKCILSHAGLWFFWLTLQRKDVHLCIIDAKSRCKECLNTRRHRKVYYLRLIVRHNSELNTQILINRTTSNGKMPYVCIYIHIRCFSGCILVIYILWGGLRSCSEFHWLEQVPRLRVWRQRVTDKVLHTFLCPNDFVNINYLTRSM